MLTLQIIIVDFIIETNTADCMQVNDSISWCNLFLTLLTQQCNFDSISNNLFCHHLFCYHFSVHLTVYLHKIYEHHHIVQNVFQFWFFMHCFLCFHKVFWWFLQICNIAIIKWISFVTYNIFCGRTTVLCQWTCTAIATNYLANFLWT